MYQILKELLPVLENYARTTKNAAAKRDAKSLATKICETLELANNVTGPNGT
jgi:hypothetical protein